MGANLNTASAPLLARISGLNESLAGNIISFRDANGPFRDRKQLLKVTRLGARTFQQAAGFLRVMNGDNPLDASAVHPETYPVVERIASRTGLAVGELIGRSSVLKTLAPEDFADAQFGVPTVKDILGELDKPSRDPRPEFKTAVFKDGVLELGDLVPGCSSRRGDQRGQLRAFVDIGVHQDGLVHVSQLGIGLSRIRDVVKAGDIVKVRVVEVDAGRKRIALTMKSGEAKPADAPGTARAVGQSASGPASTGTAACARAHAPRS